MSEGNIISLEGVPVIPNKLPDCIHTSREILDVLLRIAQNAYQITGDEMTRLLSEMHEDIPVILRLLGNTSANLERKRSLWMMAAHFEPIKWLTVPKDFLPRFELEQKERERTQAYAFFQAYKFSGEILASYGKIGNIGGFYQELPNLLCTSFALHGLGVRLGDVGMQKSCFRDFLHIATEASRDIQEGIRSMYIRRTPELDALLQPFILRVVK